MNKLLFRSLVLTVISAPLSAAPAAQIVIEAMRDNTIYREAAGSNGASNGVGDHFVAGTQGTAAAVRRGLVRFHLPELPALIQVDRVALELTLQGATNMESRSRAVSIHRLLAEWGEGFSDAGPGGEPGSGNGAPAVYGDATWRYRFFNLQTWSSYDPDVPGSGGGDFVSQPSAAATVGIDPDVVVTWETLRSGAATGMVADVEHWLADPAANFGWLLKGDESVSRTARRFYSHDHPTEALRPRLVIDYTVVPEPGALAMLVVSGIGGLIGIRGRR